MNMVSIEDNNVSIRRMVLNDLDVVSGLENSIFACPWSKNGIREILTDDKYALPYVAEIKGKIVGYAFLWVVFDEVHIGNIAVKKGYRHKKIGTLLMEYGINKSVEMGGKEFYLEVRVSNKPAIELYKKFGFVPSYVRKKYYSDNNEDALIMHKSIK